LQHEQDILNHTQLQRLECHPFILSGKECIMKLLPERIERHVQFELSVPPGCQVFVAGTFNNWNPTANPMKDNPGSGHCKVTLSLAPGRHEYKFVVNGVWIIDSNSTEWAPNGNGSLNSVLHV
jgi:1,4-alpha-glucan branching enzyme